MNKRTQLIFTFDATVPTKSPSELQFSFEAPTVNVVGNIVRRIDMYNYDTGQFEALDSRNAVAADSVTIVSPSGDLTRFVEAGTGAVRARIRYENAFPFWVFQVINLFPPFQTNVDQVFWDLSISD